MKGAQYIFAKVFHIIDRPQFDWNYGLELQQIFLFLFQDWIKLVVSSIWSRIESNMHLLQLSMRGICEMIFGWKQTKFQVKNGFDCFSWKI